MLTKAAYRFAISLVALACAPLCVVDCHALAETKPAKPSTNITSVGGDRSAELDHAFQRLREEHRLNTIGVGVIKDAKLVWSGYYGDQSSGVPASATTQFNLASITKVVTTETLLHLVSHGLVSLDEPMAEHWVDEDISQHPHTASLTPRMAVTHSTGFPNWRYLDDEKGGGFDPSLPLRFLFEPGTSYSYSGEGYQYLAKFIQAKTQTDFEDLVVQSVFTPRGMTGAAWSRREANLANIATTYDRNGHPTGAYCRPGGIACAQEGDWSAAGSMHATVPDFARFLEGVMMAEGYPKALARLRNTVHVTQENKPHTQWFDCADPSVNECPNQQGYGLGWRVADFGDFQLVGHDGSDHSSVSLTYFYSDTNDGIIIFLNAPNVFASAALPEAIRLLHPDSPIAQYYE